MMLRPNPSQRGTIQDIAHHWWMNVNYTLPVTHLPENSPSNLLITSTSYATNNNNNNINTSSRSSSSGSANHVQPSDAGKTPIVNAQSMFTRPRLVGYLLPLCQVFSPINVTMRLQFFPGNVTKESIVAYLKTEKDAPNPLTRLIMGAIMGNARFFQW